MEEKSNVEKLYGMLVYEGIVTDEESFQRVLDCIRWLAAVIDE